MPTKLISWAKICLSVEKIIGGRTIETTQKRGASEITTRRPMRFTEFAIEVGFDVGQCHRAVRGSQSPTAPLESAVREWVAKQEE